MMDLESSAALKVRWGDVVKPVLVAIRYYGEPRIIWEACEDDYQGWARILVDMGSYGGKRYAYYEWSYGSCSGCDSWEDADPQARAIEIAQNIRRFTFDELKEWGRMLREKNPGLFSSLDAYDWQNTRGLILALEALEERQ